jgi:plastocyanin
MTKMLTRISAITLIVSSLFAYALLASNQMADAATLVSLENLSAGDLIRGESFSAVYYYGDDGFRYVFPNSKTYFTWYDNFDTVKWLSDADLTKIQIGGNATYKPGIKMIKINSDPKVYVISKGGVIHPIASEAVAVALYGGNWNKMIDDVPDGFFPNYTIGSTIDVASMYSASSEVADATGIGSDKNLKAATVVIVNEDGFSPESITIELGTAVRFKNTGSNKHGASANSKKWGTGTLKNNETFSRYFDEAGTFTYYDKYDSSQTGTIVVQ